MRPSFALVCLALAASAPTPAASEVPLRLADLLAEAEAANPSLREAAERRTAAQHGPAQAQALPDPVVAVSFQNESLDRFTLGETQMSNLTLSWSQELPWAGKRRLAGNVARGEVTVLAAAEADLRAELRSRVKAAYVELLFVDRTRGLFDESRRVLAALREVVLARYESGGAELENVLRLGAEIARLDLTLVEFAGRRQRVEVELGALLGRGEQAAFGPALTIPAVGPWDPAELEAAATEGSTRIARARAAAELDERRLEAASRETKPDWSWSAGYAERGSLDPMVMGGVGVRLPLFARNKQYEAIARSQHDVAAAHLAVADVENRVLAELRALVADVQTSEAQRRTLEQAVIPQARAAYEAAQVAYENGRADFATAFDSFERQLQDTRRLEEVRAAQLGALARLEPLAGAEIVLAADKDTDE